MIGQRAETELDHFGGVTEMVLFSSPGPPAGDDRPVHHLQKMAPALVFQQGRKITGRPVFVALGIPVADAFESGVVFYAMFPLIMEKDTVWKLENVGARKEALLSSRQWEAGSKLQI